MEKQNEHNKLDSIVSKIINDEYKESYIVENEEIIFRRANVNDNFEEIAELVYETDPYIYPFWFNNDIEIAKKYLPSLFLKPGNLFNINNFYIAYDKTSGHIIGALCAIDKSVDLSYDFNFDRNVNDNYRFTIENYVMVLHKETKEEEKDVIYISNICISPNYRGKKIGSYLLGYFMSQMEQKGYNVFKLDCLLHNLRAKNLYHGMGFKEMMEFTGFDGTDNSKVEVVAFLRKKGDYFPSEFQASMLDK